MRRQRELICVVCGNGFKGAASAITCGGACRFELARLKSLNKRPEFILIAKGNGQKMPDLNAPKRLKFKKGEKKQLEEILETKIVYAAPNKNAYEGEKLDNFILDEPGQYEVPKPEPPKELTKDQKHIKISELEKEIFKVSGTQHKMGDGHPKMFALTKESKISKLKEQIEELKKQL